ncbi:MAG: DUF3536 domain-containing protein [Pseudomonadota bacterium]
MSTPILCVHGHFYQPPREDPWLEAIEPQDSAAPFENWNARISSECYAPNGLSRIRGASGRVIRVANNYSHISFNFGPTLLSWMAEHDAPALQRIVDGDKASAARLGGHGNAMAQAFSHMIMPLASPRDRRTQVRWGVADFRHRFGRDPEGMWLPETAVDLDTLEALAEQGLRFTVLAPRQARRWRTIGAREWVEGGEHGIDPRYAYRISLPSGRELALFFYDGSIAHGIAFGGLLNSGDALAEALLAGHDASNPEPQIVHVATDGESYGHHHRFGDMALAFALDRIARSGKAELANYATFLERHPPTREVEIHERSSWSCAHGVERWRSDCGCNAGTPDFHQRWRTPLREALDMLKGELDAVFEREGQHWLGEPWLARDDYIHVVLDRSDETVNGFLQRHLRGPRTDEARERALTLLEMQRHGMLMFTSCGWFFDELSGLEGTQILRYAARALQLCERHAPELEARFVKRLESAESNIPAYGNGAGVWRELVRPSRVDLERVVAHDVIETVFEQGEGRAQVYAYDVEHLEAHVDTLGDTHLGLARVRVASRLTGESCEAACAVLHFGGLDMHAWVRRDLDGEHFQQIREQARQLFRDASLGDVYDALRAVFVRDSFKLNDLFARERQRLVGIILSERVATYRSMLSSLVQPDLPVVERLWRLGYPLPPAMRLAAEIYIEQELVRALQDLDDDNLHRVQDLAERGYKLPRERRRKLALILESELTLAIARVQAGQDAEAATRVALQLMQASRALELTPNLWTAQNALLLLDEKTIQGQRVLLERLAEQLDLDPGLLARTTR